LLVNRWFLQQHISGIRQGGLFSKAPPKSSAPAAENRSISTAASEVLFRILINKALDCSSAGGRRSSRDTFKPHH
jgi:hypothetical protein